MDFYPRDADGQLADELFLIAHDDYTGKPMVAADMLDTALAGALIGELIFDGRVDISAGKVSAIDHRLRREPLSDMVLNEIIHRGNGHPVRSWLEYLRPQMRERVGARLVSAGLVTREQSRSLSLRVTVRWPGVDPNRAARPRVMLGASLQRSHQRLDLKTATLAALLSAGGISSVMSTYDRTIQERLAASRRQLPPVLAELVAGVDAAVAAAALTVRR